MDRFQTIEKLPLRGQQNTGTIERTVESRVVPEQSRLESMPAPRGIHVQQEEVLQPIQQNHMLRCQTRVEPPGLQKSMETPVVPNVKKAIDDYNSVDYQIIAMNLWKTTARELI
jgi:hypothetical protein